MGCQPNANTKLVQFFFFLDELVRIFNANTKNYTNHLGLKTKEQRKHYAITNPYTIV